MSAPLVVYAGIEQVSCRGPMAPAESGKFTVPDAELLSLPGPPDFDMEPEQTCLTCWGDTLAMNKTDLPTFLRCLFGSPSSTQNTILFCGLCFSVFGILLFLGASLAILISASPTRIIFLG